MAIQRLFSKFSYFCRGTIFACESVSEHGFTLTVQCVAPLGRYLCKFKNSEVSEYACPVHIDLVCFVAGMWTPENFRAFKHFQEW